VVLHVAINPQIALAPPFPGGALELEQLRELAEQTLILFLSRHLVIHRPMLFFYEGTVVTGAHVLHHHGV
jgi:hypothetical protein